MRAEVKNIIDGLMDVAVKAAANGKDPEGQEKKIRRLAHKEILCKERKAENNKLWYLFGRSQAIKDVYQDKYALNTIVKDKESIRLERVEKGKGVYGGLYILTDIDEDELRNFIVSDDFVAYIRLLSNYKSGGYYTFASKDVEEYLNYKLSKKYGQSRISKGNLELF